MKRTWRTIRPKLLARFTYSMIRMIAWTLRWRVTGVEEIENVGSGVLICSWHGRTLIPANHLRNQGIWALFSLSNDGELQSRIFSLLGYQVIRGSTGRGGERAAIEAIRVLRKGAVLAITPDGPRGPANEVQGGVLLIAKKSGAALLPVGCSASRRWLVGSWDRYLVPKPFAKVSVRFGRPIWISKDASEEEVESVRAKLTVAMNQLEDEAEAEVGRSVLQAEGRAPEPTSKLRS